MEPVDNTQLFDRLHTVFLLFGAEAVLPMDVRYCAPRVVSYIEEDAGKALADAQDLLDEV
jgi:hypothetical protein